MPATSKAQQHYFGMVAAGKKKPPKGMSMKQAKEFARTPTKGLPAKKGAATGAAPHNSRSPLLAPAPLSRPKGR